MMKRLFQGSTAAASTISIALISHYFRSSPFLFASSALFHNPSSLSFSFVPVQSIIRNKNFSRRNSHRPPTFRASSHPNLPSPDHTNMNMEFEFFHYPTVNSTQDQMKIILKDETQHKSNAFVAITASEQTSGRGTKGRTWIGHLGNTFLTIAVPSSALEVSPSLLPLQIGTIVTERIHQLLLQFADDKKGSSKPNSSSEFSSSLTIKWPNDILLKDYKISGILIESDLDYDKNYYYLIGIGINYQFAPQVQSQGPQRGRKATCICNHIDCSNMDTVQGAKDLGVHIAKDVKAWVDAQKGWEGAADAIIQNWERWAVFGQTLVLRDDPMNTVVIPIGIEKDGRLRVKGMDGKEQLLCFDYLL